MAQSKLSLKQREDSLSPECNEAESAAPASTSPDQSQAESAAPASIAQEVAKLLIPTINAAVDKAVSLGIGHSSTEIRSSGTGTKDD